MFRIDTSDAVPIWKQIEDEVRRLVGAGSLPPDAAVPSVRDLARELQVNPNTVAKAYQRLNDSGILAVRRGEGTFVAHELPSMAKADRQKKLRDAAARYASSAVAVGADEDEAARELHGAFRNLTRDKGGRR
jgi:GntR family transcriptional regulator